MIKENLIQYFEDSIRLNWDRKALSNYNGNTLLYKDVAEKIARYHILFEKAGIKKGDKIALTGKNSAEWAINFLATIGYGAVAVPILPDFKAKDISNIVTHSDSKLLFVSDFIWPNIKAEEFESLGAIFSLESLALITDNIGNYQKIIDELDTVYLSKYPDGLKASEFQLIKTSNDNLAEISYTSGTTGFSKGVMLSHNSLAANLRFARNNMPINAGDSILSFLPLGHSYGLAFELLFPFSLGCHITFLTKIPSPQVIMKAFSEIKPNLILSVPLIIEKIFKNQIVPQISKPAMKFLLRIPIINGLIYNKILVKLTAVFGGNFRELVIGGAAFCPKAETFFKRIGFPFAIGYGMTECGPLVSYASWTEFRPGAVGKPVDTLEVRIDSSDQINKIGEIQMKGENIMNGYYKNEEATKASFTDDGWLKSGDLGHLDKDGFIYIKGRNNNMLLGSSGQNIYPEEIESTLTDIPYVLDSLVIMRNKKLIALIYPNLDQARLDKLTPDELERIIKRSRKVVNKHLPAYMQLSEIVIREKEFEKTPKQSIKRYLYQED
ncbi:MAG: AMP-binding protein [Bacteroidales bacterium]|jgi:long-chain acyl-CoA synthetase|nr:AMP-binding protein [Bacteroidales bacterium]